ncbi:N-acetylmuramoyl-L-alanine amidase [Zavarzinia sp. CC-PAN008]|uniref:N-acetylmuramoyl-L-alanine amidase n=1 Tax=Zavarzinia sp. CC-PAN008 TaxID=3243332 RepID=UPI003F746742
MIHYDRHSPNFDERGPVRVDMLILHYTGMSGAAAALDRLCDPEARVSAHYLVDEDGRIHALVEETKRAWHAGVACWAGAHDINARSIGIELVNPGHEHGYRDFPEAQMASVRRLARDIVDRHGIQPERVLGHSDVAPDRKQDPGERFDWRGLAMVGVGLWPEGETPEPGRGPVLAPGDQGEPVAELRQALGRIGYDLAPGETFCARTGVVLTAFQRHYRPERVDGLADAGTRCRLFRLLSRIDARSK